MTIFIFSIQSTAEELRLRPDAVALEVANAVLYSANRADLGAEPQALIKMGYTYNGWRTT